MKGIRNKASQLAAFVVLPDEACYEREGLWDKARMRWEELTWGWSKRVKREITWFFGRPVRRWRRSQGRYDAGGPSMPMTAWEMQKALKAFDPHAPVVIEVPNSTGRVVTLRDQMLVSGMEVAVLGPSDIEYEEAAVRSKPDFSQMQ